MGYKPLITLMLFMFNFNLMIPSFATSDELSLDTYIIRVDHEVASKDLDALYKSLMPTTTTTNDHRWRLTYSYRNVFRGFAARLSTEEVKAMATKPGFVSARLERKISLHTTHSPNFLGLYQNTGFWKSSRYGRGVIIGVLDTGILPEHPSFNDEGMPPPPAKWKGKCEFNHTSCNNKIIGARTFTTSGDTPLDEDGHGTHTTSTAAGRFVKGANNFGNAGCWDCPNGAPCYLQGALSLNLHDDPIALGAYSAMEKGILVSCSAGNSGPSNFSLSNEAPWILTVGASTIDRKIRATAVLGNTLTFDGESAFQPADFPATQLPLVYAGMLNATNSQIRFCGEESLNKTDLRGKVVVCDVGGLISRIDKGIAVKNSGGAAMILVNPDSYGNLTLAEAHVLPATHVSYADGLKIKVYINSTAAATAAIVFKGTVIGDDRAPVVAAFSSRARIPQAPGS